MAAIAGALADRQYCRKKVTTSEQLAAKLAEWTQGKPHEFSDMALEIFDFQYHANQPYRRYCDLLAVTPATVSDWHEIPALATDCFKLPSFPLRTFPAAAVTARFLTSGTTGELRGVHEFASLELYHAAVLGGWRAAGMPTTGTFLSFSRAPAETPNSSLSAMFGALRDEFWPASEPSAWLLREDGGFECGPLFRAIAADSPISLLSTSIALLRFHEIHGPLELPAGSWIMETGGYKGLRIELDRHAFLGRVETGFGVPAKQIFNEYSMTELSSQFYCRGDETIHHGPPWVRVQVIDPETGLAAAADQPGYLQIHDLANLGSVAAIRTQDLAIAVGDSAFQLLGRDPAALPRGCSRAADDFLTTRR